MVIRPVAERDGGEGERDEQVEYTGVLETTIWQNQYNIVKKKRKETTLYEIIMEDTSLHI